MTMTSPFDSAMRSLCARGRADQALELVRLHHAHAQGTRPLELRPGIHAADQEVGLLRDGLGDPRALALQDPPDLLPRIAVDDARDDAGRVAERPAPGLPAPLRRRLHRDPGPAEALDEPPVLLLAKELASRLGHALA